MILIGMGSIEMGTSESGCANHSTLMPEVRISFLHFSV